MQYTDLYVSISCFDFCNKPCEYLFLKTIIFLYRGMKSVEVRIDDEENIQYVHMQDPLATEITFVRAPCPSKEVMYIRCSELGTRLNSFPILYFSILCESSTKV